MDIKSLMSSVSSTLRKEAPLIATGVAVISTVAAVALGVKAGMEARSELDRAEELREGRGQEPMTRTQQAQFTWKIYIPPAAATLVAIGATITLHKVGMNRTASAMALYSLSESAFGDYRRKVIEHMGEDKHKEVRKAVAQEKIDKTAPSNLIISGNEVMCYDTYSGHYFVSNMQDIKECVNDFNVKVINEMYASLTDLYELMGITVSTMSDSVGWTSDDILKVEFSAGVSEDGKPYLAVDFRNEPIVHFDRLNN